MKDPGLPEALFRRDALISARPLAQPRDWRALGDARRSGAEVTGPAPLRLRLSTPGLDACGRLALCLGNTGGEPLLAGLYLWYGEAGRSPLAFSGGRALLPPGREVTLFFTPQDFGGYGQAGPWSLARSLELVLAREKGSGAGRASLRLGELRAQELRTPPGPRLSPAGLAGLLLPQPPLPSAAPTLEQPGHDLPPPHQFARSSADELLAGLVLGEHIGWPWDWDADPRQALEWRHFLHRHHDLRTLALGWARSGRRAYLAGLRRLLTTWIVKHPVPVGGNGGAGPAWETLSVAWRLLEWAWIRGLAWDGLGARARGLMRRSAWEHARHLCDHQGHPTNWALIEAAALALTGLVWPEFSGAQAWRRRGLARLAEQCRRQFAADGSHCERSPLYQALCLQALLLVRRACLAARWPTPEPWPRAAQTALTRGLKHLAGLVRPDFTWPALNDSGGARGDYTALMAWAGRDLDRPAWRWLGSRGREGVPPRPGTRRFAQAGLVVLRVGGPGEGLWLLLRGGPPGLAHAHADGLSLEVYANGPRVLDPGISSYAPGPLTDMYRRAGAHSQPLLDGLGARPDAAATRLVRRPGLLLATAQGATAGGGMLSRQVFLVRGRYCLVWDRAWGQAGLAGPDGEHTLQAGWQLFPGSWGVEHGGRAILAADGFALRLLHASAEPVLDLARGRRRPPRGWVSLEGQDVPAPYWRMRVRGALPLQALWLLAPEAGYQAVELIGETDLQSVVLRSPGGGMDRIALGPEPEQVSAFMIPRRSARKSCP
jgi:hypothetical protein